MKKNIVAIGDSLIKGNPNPTTGGWVGRCFEHTMIKESVTLINSGRGGDNIIGVRKRLFSDCLRHTPEGVILGVGVNDSRIRDSLNGENEISPVEFRTNLYGLVSEILNSNVKSIFIVTPFPVIDRLSDPFKEDKRYQKKWVLKYRNIIINVAQEKNMWLFDKWDEWNSYPEEKLLELLGDGVHPSERGYKLISRQAKNDIEQWLMFLGIL